MADPPKKKTTVSDWLNRPPQQRPDAFEQRRKLWEALTAYIHSNGGFVTSPPDTKNLRAEVPQKSALPARLLELGYSVRSAGVGTRLAPGNTPEAMFLPVDIIEIAPGK